MDWPEAFLAIVVSVNGLILAWLTMRQQQVKNALNGSQDAITKELLALQRLVRDKTDSDRDRVIRRAPGVLD